VSCKIVVVRNQQIPQLGGPPLRHTETHCELKLRGEHEKLQVYDELFALGLEGSLATTICPVASSGRWFSCPFHQ
jgi:hypothetical protein